MTLSGHNADDTSRLVGVRWRKSTRSGAANSACVELGPLPGRAAGVAVRDSKDRDGGLIVVDDTQWAGFLGAVKRGGFDLG
jgi:hypothetical protein